MIRTFGRTGSTLLMQILGTGERICMERHYPFEQRYLTYVHNLTRMISEPLQDADNWDNDILFQGRSSMVGGLPYGRIDAFDKKALSDQCFSTLWLEFSNAMRKTLGIPMDEPAYYAEKVPNNVAERANNLIRARNLFLLRDPRDEMVSIKSFNEKRGFQSFGWQAGDSDIHYARKMCKTRRPFMRNLLKLETDDRRMYLRYEDLVLDGENEVAKLSDWLGQTLSFEEANNNIKIKNLHMTSDTAGESVERWKTELGSDVLNLFAKELGTELDGLGYSVCNRSMDRLQPW